MGEAVAREVGALRDFPTQHKFQEYVVSCLCKFHLDYLLFKEAQQLAYNNWFEV